MPASSTPIAAPKQVILFHADTLHVLGALPFPHGQVNVLKFSRNGQLLLAGGGRGGKAGKVVVWNVADGKQVIEVGDEHDAVLAADISADQTQIALGGPGKVVRVYSTKDGEKLRCVSPALRDAMLRMAPQGEDHPNLPRSCPASKSSAGPSGTMPVGLMCSMLM